MKLEYCCTHTTPFRTIQFCAVYSTVIRHANKTWHHCLSWNEKEQNNEVYISLQDVHDVETGKKTGSEDAKNILLQFHHWMQ